MRIILFSLFIVFVISCKSPEPRKPVTRKTNTSFLKKSVEINRKLIKRDENRIKEIIKADTSKNYIQSQRGFWYSYDKEIKSDTVKPQKGDKLIFEYSLQELDGEVLYTKEQLGTKEYITDQEILFSGLRDGLKLMNEGEIITFLFPSHKAFGYYGDQNKIKGNMPVKAQVTLLEINPNQNKNQ